MQKGFTEPHTAQLSLGKSLFQQLGSDNNRSRQVGSRLCEKVSNPFHQSARSGTLAKSSYILRRAKIPDSSRGEHVTRERGSHLSGKPSGHKSFYSTLFLVVKKGGQIRPVINLKKLNEWVEPQNFKMEGMRTLRELLRVNDWMVKVDLKDTYFTTPIHIDHPGS